MIGSMIGENQVSPKQVLDFATLKNAFIDLKAINLLIQRDNFEELIDESLKENPEEFITEDRIKAIIIRKETKLSGVSQEVIIEKSGKRLFRDEYSPKFRILDECDVTGKSYSEGKVENFLAYFRDKYNFLEPLLHKRQGFEPKPLSRLDRTAKNKEVHFIAMVREKQKSRSGHLIFKLEDLEAECTGLALKDDNKIMDICRNIMPDEVLGFKAVKGNDDLVIIKEVLWPDLPSRKLKTINEQLSIACISDMHIGSKMFLENEFSKFISWINGDYGDEKELEKVSRIKYLLIAGDLCDGIGVYPDQINELNIKDINEQYESFASFMKRIPESIEVFIIPGNHDCVVRRADPQPAIPKEFCKELHALGNFHFLGSPSMAEIEGFKTLLYHGNSMHQVNANVSGMDFKKPEKTMEELLKRRTLVPTYGMRHTLVPERKDYLLIREEPDIFLTGDMHHKGYSNYKGVLCLNAGTWQTVTKFQQELGHVPTPGICPTIDLSNGKITENCFYQC